MASYGAATYGIDEWGGAYELGAARLLYMLRMAPRWRALSDILDARWATLMGVAEQIRTSFDIDTAYGDLQDILGARLGLARDGMSDARYRRAMRVWVTILSSSSGSSRSLIDVFARWVEAAPDTYRNVAPAYAELIGTVPAADEYLLRQFILKTAPAGVTISLRTSTSENYLRGYSVVSGYTDEGVVDGVVTPVLDAAPLTHEVIL